MMHGRRKQSKKRKKKETTRNLISIQFTLAVTFSVLSELSKLILGVVRLRIENRRIKEAQKNGYTM